MRIRALYLTVWLLAFCLSGCQSSQAQDTSYTYRKPATGGTGKVYMGREIAAIMSSTGGSWLDRGTRQDEENSALILENMRLQPSHVVADIGAGTGFYTFRVAPRVPQGKVYAVEVQDRFIAKLRERKEEAGTPHVEVVKGSSQRANLPDSSLDMAFMVDVYHEFAYPVEMLRDIRRSLKPGGRLILIEYKAEDPNVRIRALHKMSAVQIRKELEANGFALERHIEALPLQHLLVFVKTSK